MAFPALRRALLANVFYDTWLFLVLKNQEQPDLATISEQTFLLKVLQEASVPPPILWSSLQYTNSNSFIPLPVLDNMAGLSDSMRFLKAEEFFAKTPNAKGPKSLTSANSTQSIDSKEPLRYGALLTFDQGSTCLFQFVTPQLWRLRFDPSAKNASDYSDANS